MAKLKIRNKATGEIREIEASEAQNFGLDPKVALERFKAQLELEKAAGGEDISLSTEDKKQESKKTNTERVMNQLEEIYFRDDKPLAFGQYGAGGRLPGLGKKLETAFAPSPETDRITEYKRTLESGRPFLARAAGDTGNFALAEQIVAGRGLGDIEDTPQEAISLFKSAREKFGLGPSKKLQELEKKYGVTKSVASQSEQFPQESIVNNPNSPYQSQQGQPVDLMKTLTSGGLSMGGQTSPSQPNQPNILMQLLQRGQQGGHTNLEANFLGRALFPRASDVQSRQNKGEQIGLDERFGVLGETAANVLPFAGPGGLAARLGLAGVSRGLTQPGADVEKRLLEGGKQGLMGLLLGKGGQLAGKVARPFKTVGEMRKSAIEKGKELTFSGSEIAKAGEEYLKHDPTAKTIAKKILPSIKGKQIGLPDLMKKIDVWNDAYTSAGKVGKSAEAGLNNALAKAAKAIVKAKVPDIAKANKLFGLLYGTQKNIGRAVYPAAVGTGASIGVAALLNKLGIGFGRGE